jgi:hypothetical protein
MADDQVFENPPDWSAAGEAIAAGLLKVWSTTGIQKAIVAANTDAHGSILGTIMLAAEMLALKVGEGMHKIEEPFFPIIGALTAPVVSGLFGAEVDAGMFSKRIARGGGAAAGQAIMAGFMKAIAGEGAAKMEPGQEGATRLAGAAVTATIESLFNAIATEMLSDVIPELGPHFESLSELPEEILRTLGVSRLVRRGLAPLVDVAAAVPMRWYVNKAYRPELLAVGPAVQQFLRGKWSREQLDEELARQGWSPERIEAQIFSGTKRFTESQLEELRSEHAITDPDAIAKLQELGWSAETADALTKKWRLNRIQEFHGRELSALVAAFVSREISPSEFSSKVGFLVDEDDRKSSVMSWAEHARELNVKHVSHAEIKELVQRGLATRADYRRWLQREGYADEDALWLELLIETEIHGTEEAAAAKKRAAAERAAEKAAAAAEKARKAAELAAAHARTFPGLDDYKHAVVRGLLPIGVLAARLAELKYAGDDAQFLLDLVAQDREAFLAAQAKKTAAENDAHERGLSIAEAERAVLRGVTTIETYAATLRAAHVTPDAIGTLVQTLQAELDDRAAAAAKRAEAEARLAVKGLSIAQAEKLVRQGLRTPDEYRAYLQGEGFSVVDAAVLAASLARDIAEADADHARRAHLEKLAAERGVGLAELARAVRLGARPIADYQAKLIALEMAPADQVTLMGILTAELALDDAARKKRDAPQLPKAPPAATRADVEKGVRAGLVPIAAYRAFLEAAGYSADDVDLLVGLALLEFQDVQDAKRRRAALDAENATRALGRGDVERAVKAGIATPADYGAFLAGEHYTPEDAALLVALLQHELDAAAAAEARRQALAAENATRELARADVEKAVLNDLTTPEEYAAWLSGHGYAEADVDLLVALLAIAQEKKAAKGG